MCVEVIESLIYVYQQHACYQDAPERQRAQVDAEQSNYVVFYCLPVPIIKLVN
jgi:hypothetical protein